MSLRKTGLLLAAMALVTGLGAARMLGQDAQSEMMRRAKSKVQPVYPELARKMNITGTVKLEVVVSPAGSVKNAKVIGGHPVLANAAMEAIKKWRFEPSSVESSGVLDFKFEPRN
ncbi:MAG: TonB-like protein [Candidatus Sulfotelmatobacter sp.]|nr:TonB-like protein [Candidatus Sulfotelmatobacter sp.]